ncbi:unnamed protein product [Rotaria sp. Silwood1]|nr:unnamed protein product [Rotaria sp. Silwood1]
MYPSKQQVSCFYCEWVGRKDKAKDHWKKYHPEEKFKLKISENNLTKYHFRKGVTEESTTIPNDDENIDIFEEQQQANITLLPPCLPTSTSTVSTMNNPTLLSTTNLLHTPSVPNATSDINTSSGPTEKFKIGEFYARSIDIHGTTTYEN